MKTLLLAAAAAVCSMVPALAQSSVHVTVDVPYSFQAAGSRMPAGQYELKAEMGSFILAIQNKETHETVLIPTSNDLTSSTRPAISFHVYGNQRFLASVETDGAGRELAMSAAERETRKAQMPYTVAVLRAQ